MNVFLSWSGLRSKHVAQYLSEWFCCVVQATKPWVSSRDLDRGTMWFGEINDQLRDATIGVICLTQENKHRPWILFEAGALAKGLPSSRVCTFLIDLQPTDIEDPLAQFNHTLPDKDSVRGLVKTLNATLGPLALNSITLEQVFETYWPQFDKRFKQILEETKPTEPSKPRPKESVLAEILENTRMLTSRLRKLELDNELLSNWKQDAEKSREAVAERGARLNAILRSNMANKEMFRDIRMGLRKDDPVNEDGDE